MIWTLPAFGPVASLYPEDEMMTESRTDGGRSMTKQLLTEMIYLLKTFIANESKHCEHYDSAPCHC